MTRIVFLLSLMFIGVSGIAQIRLSVLEIQENDTFKIKGTDILVVDTLIMRDNSKILLNPEKRDNFIHAKVFRIGSGCEIWGQGKKGKIGKDGISGQDQLGPCKSGGQGENAEEGQSGQAGRNLSIYSKDFALTGSLTINLNGGEGGNGGRGGTGGGGGQGTRVCGGGNGGHGGDGGHGGHGGDGGVLLIQYEQAPPLRLLLGQQLIVKNCGGFAGQGGNFGQGGPAGLGPKQDGSIGYKGQAGLPGRAGERGLINFEKK